MKKTIVCSVLLMLNIFIIDAQLLYKISGNGMKKDSYLFATHHLVPISYLDSVSDLFKCYNDCKVVVGETVVDEADAIKRMTHEASMDKDISDFLSTEEYATVDSALQKELNISLAALSKIRPAMIQQMYTMTVLEKMVPELRSNISMDAFFQHTAAQQGLKVKGLETIDDQINVLFRSQTIERQAKLLLGTIMDYASLKGEYYVLTKQYKRGKLDDIYEDFQGDTSAYKMNDAEKFIYLTNRNYLWANRIERYVQEEACFVAIGALHLHGSEGLIQLLKEKGFKVTKI